MIETFRLQYPQEKLLGVAIAFAALLAFFGHGMLRISAEAVASMGGLAWLLIRTSRPTLLVDENGYAVEKSGRESLRVAWGEVRRVRADAAEEALYVDAGDPARNLLVPPRRGFGFRFENSERLFRLVLQNIPREKIEQVERL